MASVKGFISAENLSTGEAVVLFAVNQLIGILLVVFIGYLLHVGWNLY